MTNLVTNPAHIPIQAVEGGGVDIAIGELVAGLVANRIITKGFETGRGISVHLRPGLAGLAVKRIILEAGYMAVGVGSSADSRWHRSHTRSCVAARRLPIAVGRHHCRCNWFASRPGRYAASPVRPGRTSQFQFHGT